MSVLILGGTGEARSLAQALVDLGVPVLSSLAGRVSQPALPAGKVRIGGFGGVDGLVRFLRRAHPQLAAAGARPHPRSAPVGGITAMVDATHPFAAQMSRHAAAAARRTGTPLVRLARPGWEAHPLAHRWDWVPDLTAARQAADPAVRPFLTTGRQSLGVFAAWADRTVVVRLVDPPDTSLPSRWELICSRGPYTFAGEHELLTRYAVDALVTKDSGGDYTVAKLEVAKQLDIPVVVVQRPPAEPDVQTVATVGQVLDWLAGISR